jgi:uncharacterized membrane protein YedE/YeeE
MTDFTPLASLVGGMMIGLSAVLLMLWEGRIAGISGIAGRLLPPHLDGAFLSRFGFVVGLVAAPFLVMAVTGGTVLQTVSGNLPLMAVAGLLVGFGSVFGNGCTSGHGVCGLARLSTRSFVATATFMAVAVLTVFVTRHLMGS